MTAYAYLSNLSPMWPFPAQEALIPDVRGIVTWRDNLSALDRRRHKPELLTERANMLRPSARKADLTIYMASLAVFAWTAEDMLAALTEAMKRRATIRVLDADLTIPPDAGPDVLQQAVAAFAKGRRSRLGLSAGKVGGRISAERRSAIAKAKADTVKPFWHLPSSEYSTAELVRRSGVSLNTLKLHHGSRPAAQRKYAATLKREATKAMKKEQAQ